jgi:uncharacterized repeat protein (TIGR02543 family)
MLKLISWNLYLWMVAICFTATFITSCEEDDENVPVSDVALSDSELLLINGQKQTLKAIIFPAEATNKSVTWQSSSDAVATVNERGEVEAKSVGTTIITVTTVDGNKTAMCEVEVRKPIASVTGVTLNKTELPLLVGQTETLTAVVAPENATFPEVTWESSDNVVATVSQAGVVEARAVGTATITVTTVDGMKTATCDVTVDVSQLTVKFETNGGSKVEDVIVDKGELLAAPANPVKEGGLDEGLYVGTVNPDAAAYTFDGWYTEETLENKYDFSTPVTSELTLYAKWTGNNPLPIDIESATGSNILEKGYNYLNALSSLTSLTEYTLVLASDVKNPAFSGDFTNKNVSLLLIGKGEERVISRTNISNIFLFKAGTFIIGDKITLTASGIGNFYPVYLMGTANAIMKEGAKISNVTGATGSASAVYLNDGNCTFTMEGGEICNNMIEPATEKNCAAVAVVWGTFNMKGGIISGNEVKTRFNTKSIAGGVYVNNWNKFHKTGGVIKNNKAQITAAEAGAGKTGQQVFYSANNGNASTWRKVDEALEEGDNLTTDNMSNPLWKNIE